MMLQYGKNWLTCIALLLLAGMVTPGYGAGLPAEVVYEDTAGGALPVKKSERVMASADRIDGAKLAAIPASVPVISVDDQSASATVTGEKIDVVFQNPENDAITREAIEKLNIIIESLEFANADLHNVIRIIGERLNINFIFDAEDISGKVTLRLQNVRLKDALDSILSTRKLAIVADRSGIFRIVPKEQVGGKSVETKTEVIQLNWISAEDVQKSLKSFISDGIGKMDINEESNALIITDVPPQLDIVRDLITQIDLPERQVLIEARLADINIGAMRELGTKWSLTKPNENTTALPAGAKLSGLTDPLTARVVPQLLEGFDVTNGVGTLGLGDTIGLFGNTFDLNAVFTALENRSVVEILANPRVTTLNNVPAKINIIEKIPYIQASGMSSGGTSVPTVAFEDAGVDIQVKPIITPNGFVRMEIILKQMIFRKRVGTGELDPPLIDIRSATTNVIIKDLNTVVLGGLRQQRRQEQSNGVPWLHEVPFLGWLFKDKQVDQTKTELVLMMTPKIIEQDASLTDREKFFYDKIDNDWHLPDYFFDDVSSDLGEASGAPAQKIPEAPKS